MEKILEILQTKKIVIDNYDCSPIPSLETIMNEIGMNEFGLDEIAIGVNVHYNKLELEEYTDYNTRVHLTIIIEVVNYANNTIILNVNNATHITLPINYD
jgi:hypothetical protein